MGVLLTRRRPKWKDFHYLVEHVKAKQVAWKGKLLSFKGKATLAKLVI